MKKLSKKEVEKITEKLKPYWRDYRKLQNEFSRKKYRLENKMNRRLRPLAQLELFYVDGECVGIGAADYSARKFFPLIHDRELND